MFVYLFSLILVKNQDHGKNYHYFLLYYLFHVYYDARKSLSRIKNLIDSHEIMTQFFLRQVFGLSSKKSSNHKKRA